MLLKNMKAIVHLLDADTDIVVGAMQEDTLVTYIFIIA